MVVVTEDSEFENYLKQDKKDLNISPKYESNSIKKVIQGKELNSFSISGPFEDTSINIKFVDCNIEKISIYTVKNNNCNIIVKNCIIGSIVANNINDVILENSIIKNSKVDFDSEMIKIDNISINNCIFNKSDSKSDYKQGLDLFGCEKVSIKNSKISGGNCSILIKKSEVSIEDTILKSSKNLIFTILSNISIYNISTNIKEDFMDNQKETYIECEKCPDKMKKRN